MDESDPAGTWHLKTWSPAVDARGAPEGHVVLLPLEVVTVADDAAARPVRSPTTTPYRRPSAFARPSNSERAELPDDDVTPSECAFIFTRRARAPVGAAAMDEPFCSTLTRLLLVVSLWSLGCATRVTGSEGGDAGAPPADALVPPRDVATLDRAADSLEDRGADQGADGGDVVDASDRLDARADLVAADAATDAPSRADIICDRPPRQDVGGAGLVLCMYDSREPVVCSSGTLCNLHLGARCANGLSNFSSYLSCDGGEDCAEGEFCCRTTFPYPFVECKPRPMCRVYPSGSGILCHQDADCPCDLPRCCGRADFDTVVDSRYRTCVASCDGS